MIIYQNRHNEIWGPVLDALENRNKPMYYIGGTLCIDLDNKKGICLNLDGTGFTVARNSPLTKNLKVYAPSDVLEYVRIYYLEHKNNLDYFNQKVYSKR
jgi:hypothetical protein